MKHELTANQEQYLKGLLSMDLPIVIKSSTLEDVEEIAKSIYKLMKPNKRYVRLDFLLADPLTKYDKLASLAEEPKDKIIFTHTNIPSSLEHSLSDYLLITMKRNEDGVYNINSKLTELSKASKKLIKLRPTDPPLQAPKYNGEEVYQYLVYDEKGKLRAKDVVTANSLPELQTLLNFALSRKTIKVSQTSLLGKNFEFDSVLIFEVKVDSIDLPNEEIGDYLEQIRKVAKDADIYIIALVTV